jgi:CBS domain-containing protein
MLRTTVSDVMVSDVVTASPDASFVELARLLHGAGVRAVPIVDRTGVLLGVVSEADLMASAARPDTAPGRWRARHLRRDQPEAKAGATTAAELMTPFVEAVAPTTTVATAARLMVERRLRWMPVCDAAGCVLGVVSRSDVLSIFLRDDESIRAEIADEVLGGRDVQVDVHDGICSLAGGVGTRGDAERLVRVVERVEGVVAVEDHLTHRSAEQLVPPVVESRSDPRAEHVP